MGSRIAFQMSELSEQLQSSREELTRRFQQYNWNTEYLPTSSQVQEAFTGGFLPRVVQGLQAAVWALTALVVIAFVGLYLAYDPDVYITGLVKLFPQHRRRRYRQLLETMRSALSYWILGRFISMALVGVLTAVGLWLLGIPLPITLGVLAALLTFIPNIGPIISAVPQALIALQVGVNAVAYVLIFNVVLQGVESYLITPVIQRYEVTLPPAVTISVQLLMGVLVGIIGIMMAAPLTAAIMVIVQSLYIADQLHDPNPGELVETN
jgi:predicted PurR-regulated permease PerM